MSGSGYNPRRDGEGSGQNNNGNQRNGDSSDDSRPVTPSGLPPSRRNNGHNGNNGHHAPGSLRPGDKRGRDRSLDANHCGGQSKFQRNGSGNAVGNGRKKREEFFDQIVTRPEGTVKHAEPLQKDSIVNVVANYFKVEAPELSVTGYRVDFEPQVEVPAIRRRLIFQIKSTLGDYVYDGASEIFILRSLLQNRTQLTAQSREGDSYIVILREIARVHFTEARFLQVLNLVLRRAMRELNLKLIGRNFFDADENVVINIEEFRLQIWPGYDTSIRQHEYGLLLNCDLRHKVMRQENVHSIIRDCLRSDGVGNYRDAVTRRVVGATVLTDYNNATYKISAIDWDQTPSQTFETRNGPVSFIDYYRNKYNLNIKDPKQPLLVCNASARNIRAGQPEYILLVPELCRMTGLTDEDRRNFNLMRAMANRTRMNPTDRVNKLLRFSQRINTTPGFTDALAESRLQIDRQLVSFDARRFECERLQIGTDPENPRNFITLDERADWTRSMQQSMFKFVLAGELKHWYFVYPSRLERTATSFMNAFMTAANGFSRNRGIVRAREVQLQNDHPSTYEKEVKQILREDPSFLMVVIPSKRDEIYKALKRLTIGQSQARPVAIQVITDRTCGNPKNLMSIATKVVIQVNCKLGGIPWNVDMRLGGIMIVGFDISIGKGKRGTYGAMVASLNPKNEGGHYFSMAQQHRDGTMLSNNFAVMIRGALHKYCECNDGTLPERIMIYRDGVGDGDLQFVYSQEVKNIQKAISSVYGEDNDPKFAFIVVNKKTNTRIMQKARPGSREAYSNPLPGTVIDDVITLPERIDFYLISQSVNQGTVSPVYYNVLENSFFPSTRGLQQISYKLCHNYFNWTGTVRVPSVVQYAKKLAMLAQDTLNGVPSEEIKLEHQLYFL